MWLDEERGKRNIEGERERKREREMDSWIRGGREVAVLGR